jgi:putative hydrolase of the HAD superfamily
VETGKIDPLDYFEQFCARIGLSWTFDQWLDLWANIFTINPFGHGLYLDLHKKGYPVAMLSNIGPHQATAIEHRFPDLFKIAVNRFFSYELGLHKPDPRIYHAVCQRLAKQPSQCVLLDDLPDNVKGAQGIGMHAMQFTPENHPAIEHFIRSFC